MLQVFAFVFNGFAIMGFGTLRSLVQIQFARPKAFNLKLNAYFFNDYFSSDFSFN